jgi:pyridoxal phosphate enzyme (YggS family)
MNIAANIQLIRKQLPENVQLIAVSKFQPVDTIQEAYHAGQRIFGENKAQECAAKAPLLANDIKWHFIGHLQTNKVKVIAPFVSLIHSIDSIKLLSEVNKEAAKNNRIIDCLLQFYIAMEESKFGLSLVEANELLTSPEYASFKNIRIVGVMGMASFIEDMQKVRAEFAQLKTIFDRLKTDFFGNHPDFIHLSMGMSHDFIIAIEEGSTMVRIGTAIFNERHK